MEGFVPLPELNHVHAKAKLYLMMCRIRTGLRRVVNARKVDYASPYATALVQEIVRNMFSYSSIT